MPRSLTTGRTFIRLVSGTAIFNGLTSQIDLGASGQIASATAAFTVACYFKRDAITQSTALAAMVGDNNNSAQNHWNFQVQGPGRKLLSTLITTVGAKALVGVRNISQGNWFHGALTYDGASITFYLCGVADNMTTHTGTIIASTAGMFIGNGSAPIGGVYRKWNSRIAEVKYWDRALSSTEIADLYFSSRDDSSIRTGLKGEWLLSSNANDSSGLGNNGTTTAVSFDASDVPFQLRSAVSGRVPVSDRSII